MCTVLVPDTTKKQKKTAKLLFWTLAFWNKIYVQKKFQMSN